MPNNGDIVRFLKQKDYKMIDNNLGSGSFGKTVVLQDPFTEELFVAKKYMPDSETIKKEFYQNFIDEIKILYKLNHRNIVRIFGYYPYPDNYTGYIIMERVDGIRIDEYFNRLAVWDTDVVNNIFIQLIDAFCHLESRKIIHRDIRESNILIDKDDVVKIIDFGIGKTYSGTIDEDDSLSSRINREDAITLPQEYNEQKYTKLTDMFYLGDMFKRLVHKLDKELIDGFSFMSIVNKMSDRDPSNRYESFATVMNSIKGQEFNKMTISNADKETYRNFADILHDIILQFLGDPKFIFDPEIFSTKIHAVLDENVFEEIIQNPTSIIGAFIESKYSYDDKKEFPRDTLEKFIVWFDSLNTKDQKLIMANLRAKVATIDIDIDINDIPF